MSQYLAIFNDPPVGWAGTYIDVIYLHIDRALPPEQQRAHLALKLKALADYPTFSPCRVISLTRLSDNASPPDKTWALVLER